MRTLRLAVGFALASDLAASDVTGVWKAEFNTQVGTQNYAFTFKQDAASVTGKASSDDRAIAGSNFKVRQAARPVS